MTRMRASRAEREKRVMARGGRAASRGCARPLGHRGQRPAPRGDGAIGGGGRAGAHAPSGARELQRDTLTRLSSARAMLRGFMSCCQPMCSWERSVRWLWRSPRRRACTCGHRRGEIRSWRPPSSPCARRSCPMPGLALGWLSTSPGRDGGRGARVRPRRNHRACVPAGSGVGVRGHGPGFGSPSSIARRPMRSARQRRSGGRRGVRSTRVPQPTGGLRSGDPAEVESFAEQVARQLGERQNDVPRGALSEDEERGRSLYRLTLQTVGRCIAGDTFTVGLDIRPRALTLPPSGRNLHVVQVSGAEIPAFLLEPFSGAITSWGGLATHSFSERAPRLSPGLARGVAPIPPRSHAVLRSTDRSTCAAWYNGERNGQNPRRQRAQRCLVRRAVR